jgi:hypothetical protein
MTTWIDDGTSATGHKIRVILKSVTKPDTILPFRVEDHDGRVLCRTLGISIFEEEGRVVVTTGHCPYTSRWMYYHQLDVSIL